VWASCSEFLPDGFEDFFGHRRSNHRKFKKINFVKINISKQPVKASKKNKNQFQLLQQLCQIQAPSGHERPVKDFLLTYVKKERKHWRTKPEIIEGEEFQDCLIFHVNLSRCRLAARPVLAPGNLLAQRPSIDRQSVKVFAKANAQRIRREGVARN